MKLFFHLALLIIFFNINAFTMESNSQRPPKRKRIEGTSTAHCFVSINKDVLRLIAKFLKIHDIRSLYCVSKGMEKFFAEEAPQDHWVLELIPYGPTTELETFIIDNQNVGWESHDGDWLFLDPETHLSYRHTAFTTDANGHYLITECTSPKTLDLKEHVLTFRHHNNTCSFPLDSLYFNDVDASLHVKDNMLFYAAFERGEKGKKSTDRIRLYVIDKSSGDIKSDIHSLPPEYRRASRILGYDDGFYFIMVDDKDDPAKETKNAYLAHVDVNFNPTKHSLDIEFSDRSDIFIVDHELIIFYDDADERMSLFFFDLIKKTKICEKFLCIKTAGYPQDFFDEAEDDICLSERSQYILKSTIHEPMDIVVHQDTTFVRLYFNDNAWHIVSSKK